MSEAHELDPLKNRKTPHQLDKRQERINIRSQFRMDSERRDVELARQNAIIASRLKMEADRNRRTRHVLYAFMAVTAVMVLGRLVGLW